MLGGLLDNAWAIRVEMPRFHSHWDIINTNTLHSRAFLLSVVPPQERSEGVDPWIMDLKLCPSQNGVSTCPPKLAEARYVCIHYPYLEPRVPPF